MLAISLFCAAVSAVGLILSTQTRAAILGRIARHNGCPFEKRKDSVTTLFSAGKLEFFMFFFHQYRNVFTYSDKTAFVRLADDFIYSDENPKTKPIAITIFTAELKKGQFPHVKVVPSNSPFAFSQHTQMKTNIPAIDSRYRIYTTFPEGSTLFSPMITGLFKTRPGIYLELNDNALIYHEHTLVPATDIEMFRFRAIQLLNELATVALQAVQETAQATPTPASNAATPPLSMTETQAAALLQIASSRLTTARRGASLFGKVLGLLVMLSILIGISFLSWFVLRGMIHL